MITSYAEVTFMSCTALHAYPVIV